MKSKAITQFVCKNCGSNFSSWYGKCPDCNEWNTLTEFRESAGGNASSSNMRSEVSPVRFEQLNKLAHQTSSTTRHSSHLSELDRVLGGGFVHDAVVLLSGEPGVGKSTLLLSVLAHKKKDNQSVVYVSTEEESSQIENRAKRLGVDTTHILFASEKNIDNVLSGLKEVVEKQKIPLIIFDSLQGFYVAGSDSLPGGMSQSKDVLLRIVEFSKKEKVTSIVVGHITKEGDIAGPKFLEHMVDCVLFLEGEKMTNLRMLRVFKNRFGPTDEVGFLEMTGTGIQEVSNPSKYFLDEVGEMAGKAAIGVRQGMRIVFATVESLVVSTNMAFPRRVAKGIDTKRFELILAILKKYLKLPVDKYDIYINISGGLRVDDPLADFGVAASVYSSLTGTVFSAQELFVGEVGLLGTIRKTNMTDMVNREGKRLGFTKIRSAHNTRHIREMGK